MKQKAYEALADTMIAAPGQDFTLDAIYRIVCRPPHQELMSTEQLHSRCGRAISEARRQLGPRGYVIVAGALRHSYRAVTRSR
jgi:hypothetical protein